MRLSLRASRVVLAGLAFGSIAELAACASDRTDDSSELIAAGAGGTQGGSSAAGGSTAAAGGHGGGGASGHGGAGGSTAGHTAGGSGGAGGHGGATGGHSGGTGGSGHAGTGTAGGGAGGAVVGAGGGTGGDPVGAGGNGGDSVGAGGTDSAGGVAGSVGAGGTAGGETGGTGAGGDGSAGSPSSFPTDPISYTKEKPFTVDSGTTNWVYVPNSYDDTHMTPITLLVWLHGCGGVASGDVWVVSPGGSQSWISLAVGGQEGNCWDVDNDPARVLAALADIKTHFNIAPKKVILGGYSSGGDLTYRTAFYNAGLFAGVIVENSSPYRDTGSSEAASLAAASWKFNAVHLAHLQDTTYPIKGVRTETDSMKMAGFPMMRLETDGGHYDDAGAIENGHAVPGTDADLASFLLPYLSAGWTAP